MKKVFATAILSLLFHLALYSQNSNSGEILKNQDIVDLVKSKVPASVVVNKIQGSKCDFDLSSDAIIHLTQNQVPEDVINAMLKASKGPGNENQSRGDDRATIAEEALRKKISDESKHAISLSNFEKTNGFEQEVQGMKMYVVEWKADIITNQEIWKKWNMMDGAWSDFYVVLQPPTDYWASFEMGSLQHYKKNSKLSFTGTVYVSKTDNGFRSYGVNVKTYRIVDTGGRYSEPQAQSRQTEKEEITLDTTSINYISLLTHDSSSLNIQIAIIKENENRDVLLMKMLKNIFSMNNKLIIDRAPSKQKYVLQCTLATGYTATGGGQDSLFSGIITITQKLYDVENKKLLMAHTYTVTNNGGVFTKKQLSRDKALVNLAETKLHQVVWQFMYANFPKETNIVEVTDSNRAGEAKQVKIAVGVKDGINKECRFKIADSMAKKSEYDFVVVEANLDYSICKVVDNKEYLKTLTPISKAKLVSVIDPKSKMYAIDVR